LHFEITHERRLVYYSKLIIHN